LCRPPSYSDLPVKASGNAWILLAHTCCQFLTVSAKVTFFWRRYARDLTEVKPASALQSAVSRACRVSSKGLLLRSSRCPQTWPRTPELGWCLCSRSGRASSFVCLKTICVSLPP
jgi:hypothetical protein